LPKLVAVLTAAGDEEAEDFAASFDKQAFQTRTPLQMPPELGLSRKAT
jgi:hypothetical protein